MQGTMSVAMKYKYALLAPLRAPDAEARNSAILGRSCLGIEVTEPQLAERCCLGNIDPQHSGERATISAITAASSVRLPPAGSTLVTIRPDADAIGAMAAIAIRADGIRLSAGARRRIALIDEADRFARGGWPGRRPLPQSANEIDEIQIGREGEGAMAGLALTPGVSLESKVESFRNWILTGHVPDFAYQRTQEARVSLFKALTQRRVIVRDILPSRLACVCGIAPGGSRMGYRMAPVVVAESRPLLETEQEGIRKVTVSQYESGYADLDRLNAALSELEPGWGGSRTIIGSPQGLSCNIAVSVIIRLAIDSLNRDQEHHSLNGGG